MWIKKADGTVLAVSARQIAVNSTFDERFSIPLDFDFFKHPVFFQASRKVWL